MRSSDPSPGEPGGAYFLDELELTFAVAGIVNAVMIFATFALTLPAIAMPTRGWLKISGYLIVIDALFSVVLGLYMWILTLRTKETFSPLWNAQSPTIQDDMQRAVCSRNPVKARSLFANYETNEFPQFMCCGYFNSTSPAFVTDAVCTSPAAAALIRGCAGPIASFANVFVDQIFTAAFGMAGIDAALLLATACLSKERKEQARFRYIDQKAEGKGGF